MKFSAIKKDENNSFKGKLK